jgi:Fic family protein
MAVAEGSGESISTEGRFVRVLWNEKPVSAWVPGSIAGLEVELRDGTARITEQAALLSRRASDSLPSAWLPLAGVLFRSEGIASSFIEGITAPALDVAMAVGARPTTEAAKAVAKNVAALTQAMTQTDQVLTEAILHGWHSLLMVHARYLPAAMIGAFRNQQGWIGGTSPLDAALVTPPPEFVHECMVDLLAYINRTDVDPVTQAAVAHAQFESIHPYADGNGRIGRVLIAWMLSRRLQLVVSPPVSMHIARDRGGYLSGLVLFQQNQTDTWVRWFAGAVKGSAEAAIDIANRIEALLAQWNVALGSMRSDAAARKILQLFPERLVVSSAEVAAAAHVCDRAARNALGALHKAGIINQFISPMKQPGRPHQLWFAPSLIDLISRWR